MDARVRVKVGDGTAGWPPYAPYDRVISTYAVDRIPWSWVAQTRPGGRIVTPWGRLGHVALTVAEDGRSATGWIQGLAQFMPARGTFSGPDDFSQVRGDAPAPDKRPWERDLGPLRDDWHLRFALRVALPDVRITVAADDDGLNAWLHDGITSWAALSAVENGKTLAHQGGPRRLADELEQAWEGWLEADKPDLYDYGLTVEPEHQYAWAHDADTGWPLTPADGLCPTRAAQLTCHIRSHDHSGPSACPGPQGMVDVGRNGGIVECVADPSQATAA